METTLGDLYRKAKENIRATKGPWGFAPMGCDERNRYDYWISGPNGEQVADKVYEHNRDLVCAAPDLYRLVRAMVNASNSGEDPAWIVDEMSDLIDKLEGKA